MSKEFTVNGKKYTARALTLSDISFDDLIGDGGKLNHQMLVSAGVRDADGKPVDLSKVPIGHAMKFIGPIMEVCGFSDKGND